MGNSNEEKKAQKMKIDRTYLVLLAIFALLISVALAWPKPDFPEVSQERLQDDPFRGALDAPVTIIEYGDYACEPCRMWHNAGVLDEILERYPQEVRFVWRDNARRSTASLKAAEAAQCAHNQGKFWDYHAQLFEQSGGIGPESLRGYARAVGLDMDEFNACLDEHQMRRKVQYDMRRAGEYGLSVTPAFVINGETIVGPPPVRYLAELIDRLLEEEG